VNGVLFKLIANTLTLVVEEVGENGIGPSSVKTDEVGCNQIGGSGAVRFQRRSARL